MIDTILFDLHGVLIDTYLMHKHQPQAQAEMLTERYGGEQAAWRRAWEMVREDWDSYWADLDLSGDDSVNNLYEGELRVLRAHFRITGTPYPPIEELLKLARRRSYLVLRRFDAGYDDAREAAAALDQAGYKLGVVSNAPREHCQGALEGAGMLKYFEGQIVGSDTIGALYKGKQVYWHGMNLVGSPPETCVVVDDNLDGIQGARGAGAHTVLVERPDRSDHRPLDWAREIADAVLPGLAELPAYIQGLNHW